jgi:hypothetical protein
VGEVFGWLIGDASAEDTLRMLRLVMDGLRYKPR